MADSPQHWMTPTTEETALYECGHEGPITWTHALFGEDGYTPPPEFFEGRKKCGQCWLDEATDGITQCASCKTPIRKGDDCLMISDELRCLKDECAEGGPLAHTPGVWSGTQWVDGITAGTIRTL